MYIKLGRLNILPTSDPKSANSRYFQGHQLIKPYFCHKVSRQMIAQFNSCQYGSRNITSGFDSEETHL